MRRFLKELKIVRRFFEIVKEREVWRVQGAKVNSLREEKRDLGQGVVRREGKVGEGSK